MLKAQNMSKPVRGMSEREAEANRKWLQGYRRRIMSDTKRQDDDINFHLAQARLYRTFAQNARSPGVKRYWTVAAVNAETKHRELLA